MKCFWQQSQFELEFLLIFSPYSQTACYSPHIAVSALSCLLIQLLLGLQVKNISSKRSGVFILTEIIPAICFIGCSEKQLHQHNWGCNKFQFRVGGMSRDILEALLLRDASCVRSISKVKLLQVNKLWYCMFALTMVLCFSILFNKRIKKLVFTGCFYFSPRWTYHRHLSQKLWLYTLYSACNRGLP